MRAQEFLELKKVKIGEVVDAKKTRIDQEAAWELLRTAGSVTIAKGQKVETFTPAPAEKAAILAGAMGPSGNLRAPTWRAGERVVIGFHEGFYADWLK